MRLKHCALFAWLFRVCSSHLLTKTVFSYATNFHLSIYSPLGCLFALHFGENFIKIQNVFALDYIFKTIFLLYPEASCPSKASGHVPPQIFRILNAASKRQKIAD